jgi:acyl-CoA synthetase (AMP-forming)/AMP-acid ligase II
VPAALIRAYQDRGLTFVQGYGLTETSPGALFLRAADSVRKADGILGFLDGRLARYKIPKSVVFTRALPRNGAGKVVKSQLRSAP